MSFLPEPGQGAWLQRCIAADRRWALSLHRASSGPLALAVLQLVSWLGNGPLWYASLLALPLLQGPAGWACARQMVAVGGLNLILYLCLKHATGRPRPHVACPDIRQCARALDRFSFPSGHVLHAVAFAMVMTHHFPPLAGILWPFVLLVAVSRVSLGLHYPSDVLAGALIGAMVASSMLE